MNPPVDNLVTNSNKVRIKGTATSGSDAVTIVSVTANGTDIDLDDDGVFDFEYTTPAEGQNELSIVATDSLGKTSTVLRYVLLDTKAPVFSDIHLDDKVINANGHFRLTFKLTDPEQTMIVRVWGVVNDESIAFFPLENKPGYWYGIRPRVPVLQDIERWAENDNGGRGHLKCQMYIEWHTETLARLILIPIQVKLLTSFVVARLSSVGDAGG